jgi:hypothetical protein
MNQVQMTAELREYLENEFADFEKAHFAGERFWRAPVNTLVDTPLFEVYQNFSKLFPDHPNDYDTVFYLLQRASGEYSILFRCAHFEHAWSDELRTLAKFIHATAKLLTGSDGGMVELLDGNSEKLHIRLYDPQPHIVSILQTRASRTP